MIKHHSFKVCCGQLRVGGCGDFSLRGFFAISKVRRGWLSDPYRPICADTSLIFAPQCAFKLVMKKTSTTIPLPLEFQSIYEALSGGEILICQKVCSMRYSRESQTVILLRSTFHPTWRIIAITWKNTFCPTINFKHRYVQYPCYVIELLSRPQSVLL